MIFLWFFLQANKPVDFMHWSLHWKSETVILGAQKAALGYKVTCYCNRITSFSNTAMDSIAGL